MITLKIKKAGHTVDIPGLPTCRSPVEVDISKLDIRVVAMSLKTSGISEYEIIADIGHAKEVYTKKDFEVKEKKPKSDSKKLDKRLDKLEKMISTLLEKGSSAPEKEQTIKKQKLSLTLNEPEIEEFEAFIPDIDTSQMKISSKNLKTIKQDTKDLDDSADALSSLIKK